MRDLVFQYNVYCKADKIQIEMTQNPDFVCKYASTNTLFSKLKSKIIQVGWNMNLIFGEDQMILKLLQK